MLERARTQLIAATTLVVLALPLAACSPTTPVQERDIATAGKAPLLIAVRPEQVGEALALAKTLPVPRPTTQPADGGLVFIAFAPLTEEQSLAVFKSGLVQMSAKTGVIVE